MLTLSSAADTALARSYWDLRFLLQLDFTAPISTTLRVSDQYLASCGGQEWLPLVQSWGVLSERWDPMTVAGQPSTFEVVLSNSLAVGAYARLSDMMYSTENPRSTFEFTFAKATLYLAPTPTAAADDLVTLGVFYLEEPQDTGQGTIRLRMSDLAAALETKAPLQQITSDVFAEAHPDDFDRHIPIVFGDFSTPGKKVRAIPLVAGKTCILNGAHTSSVTTITVDSTTGFPDAGDLLIGRELITYTGRTATTFTGGTRPSRGSIATAHADKDTVFEARSGTSAYRFAVSENVLGGVSSIPTVYANGLAISTATVRTAVTTLVTGKSFALVDFDLSGDTAIRQFHTTPLGYETFRSSSIPASLTEVDNNTVAAHVVNLSVPSAPTSAMAIKAIRLKGSFTYVGGGADTLTSWTLWSNGSNTVQIANGVKANEGQSYEYDVPVTALPTTWGLTWYLTLSSGTNPQYTFVVEEALLIYDTRSASGAKATTDAVVGELSVLVQGITDDASGTISGTADLLLENPTDITKAILTQVYDTTPGIAIADCGDTWAASRAAHASAGMEWALVLDEARFSQLRQELSRQGRAMLYFAAGKAEWKYLGDGPSIDQTVTYDMSAAKDTPVLLRRVDRSQLVNSLTVNAQVEPLTGTYGRSVKWEDLTQPGGFADRAARTIALSAVQDATTADVVGRFWRDQWKRPRLASTFRTWWDLTAVQLGDVLAFSGHPTLGVHGGATLAFRVVGRQVDPRRGCLVLDVLEAANPSWTRETPFGAVITAPVALAQPASAHRVAYERMLARRAPSESVNVFGRRHRLLAAMGG